MTKVLPKSNIVPDSVWISQKKLLVASTVPNPKLVEFNMKKSYIGLEFLGMKAKYPY